jgi:anti-sigma B factor antagonist
MTELASLQIVSDAGLVRVILAGELDAASAPGVRSRLDAALRGPIEGLVLDLQGVEFMDSAGVELLFRLRHDLAVRGVRLTLVVAPDALIRRTLMVADGGQELLEIVDAPAS